MYFAEPASFYFIRTAVVFIFLFTISTNTNSKSNDVVLAIGATDWAPYHYHDESGNLKGTDITLLKNTLSLMGRQLNVIKPIPLKRLTRPNQSLGFNTLLGATHTKERAEYYYISAPYRKEVISIYYTKQEFDTFSTLSEFFKYSYAVVGAVNTAAFYGKEFEKIKSSFSSRIFHLENAQRRIEQLSKGKVSFLIGDAKNIDWLLNQHPHNRIKKASFNVVEQDVSFMFHKSQFDEKFLAQFNEALHKKLR